MDAVVNGIRVNYVMEGQGETVLLLHGWGSSLEPYRALMDQLKEKYRVVALDFPGFGGSDEPDGPWDVDGFVDFTLAFIETLQVKKLSLVGHSFGGRVIIKMANRELPFEISKITLIGSAGIKPPKSNKKSFRQTVFKAGKWFLSLKPVAKLWPEALEKLRVKFGSADYAAATPLMRQCLVKAINEDLTHLLPGIKAPTLLIWGENDTATPLADGKLMEKSIPDAGLAVIPGVGHYCFLENPWLFKRIIASYYHLG